MIQLYSREEAGLPRHPDSYYPGPYAKVGVCLHNMACGTPDPVSLEAAKLRTRINYQYHRSKWNGIDILEAYDLYNVDGRPVFIEGRPWWSNSDAFSGMAKLGYCYIGLEVHGNYDKQQPTDVILDGISDFLAACYVGGKIKSLEMKGHLDFNAYSNCGSTSCPGRNLYPRIPELIEDAKRKVKNDGEEEDMPRFGRLERPDLANTYVYGCARVVAQNVIFIHAEGGNHDYRVTFYAQEKHGPRKESKTCMLGGWNNRDGNYGGVIPVAKLFDWPELSLIVHSPVPLAFEIK